MLTVCGHCGKSFGAEREAAKFCSHACRQAAYEARKRPVVELQLPPEQLAEPVDTIEARCRADLAAAGRLETPLGAAALRAARILDQSSTMNGYAALMAQWQKTLSEALAGAVVEPDVLDELRVVRDRRFAG